MVNPVPKIFQRMKEDECSASRLWIRPPCVSTIKLTRANPPQSFRLYQQSMHTRTQPSKTTQAYTVTCSCACCFLLQPRIRFSLRRREARQVKEHILKSVNIPRLYFGRCLYDGLGQYACLEHDMWLVLKCPFNSVVNSLACKQKDEERVSDKMRTVMESNYGNYRNGRRES